VITRYLQKQIDSMKWPQLLVLKDKHETDYYLCSDVAALGRACLAILKARTDPKHGYIQDPGPESEIYGLKKELTKEAAEALPDPYREEAIKVIKANARLRAAWKEEVENYETAKKALKEKDGMAAFAILHDRRDHEYEGFEFVRPIIP
jgi:hypothetical protein